MSKFSSSKGPLFRSTRCASMDLSWPISRDSVFPVPSKKDAITEHIIFEMKQRNLLKLRLGFGSPSTLRIEAPRNDRLFKIRRVER